MNSRRRTFCEYYVQGMSATEAAKRAGYSPRSARSQGQRLLTNDDVQKMIHELQTRATNERIADALEIRERFTAILRDDKQKASARLRAGEALLKHGGDGPGERIEEPGERIREPEAPGTGVEIVLPWRPADLFYPTAYEGEDGQLIPLENPGEGMTLVLTRQQMEDMERRYHVHGDQSGDPLHGQTDDNTTGGKDNDTMGRPGTGGAEQKEDAGTTRE